MRMLLLDDSGQTNACCALLVTPTRGPERLEGCAQPPHQQERTRPEVGNPSRRPGLAVRVATQRLEFACSQNWALRVGLFHRYTYTSVPGPSRRRGHGQCLDLQHGKVAEKGTPNCMGKASRGVA
eukprot:COSAG06_NODE_5100_length_3717_cov_4.907131_4_plen_125_part_00